MKETKDKKTGDKYIYFNKNKIVSTKSLTKTISVDVDINGNVVGIEILKDK